jgi:hypothetical protein
MPIIFKIEGLDQPGELLLSKGSSQDSILTKMLTDAQQTTQNSHSLLSYKSPTSSQFYSTPSRTSGQDSQLEATRSDEPLNDEDLNYFSELEIFLRLNSGQLDAGK